MEFSEADIALIRKTVAQDASDADLEMFVYACKKTGLDPLMRQIHMVFRGKNENRKAVIMAGIDGYRLIAARTGEYAGNEAAQFISLDEQHPVEATITVWRMVHGVRCPFTATARWFEYAPDGKGDFMWQKMPFTMLGKVAEALALRKAFPAELSGVYAEEEMAQADNAPRPVAAIPQRTVTRAEAPAQPAPQEAPRGTALGPDVPCQTCGVPTFLFKDGKMRGHKQVIDGKDVWHRQPVTAPKPADAPATKPETKTGIVVLADKPAPTGGTPEPKNMGEVMVLAKDRKGMGFQAVLDFFAARKVEEIRITPAAAWAKLNAEKPDVAGVALFQQE